MFTAKFFSWVFSSACHEKGTLEYMASKCMLNLRTPANSPVLGSLLLMERATPHTQTVRYTSETLHVEQAELVQTDSCDGNIMKKMLSHKVTTW